MHKHTSQWTLLAVGLAALLAGCGGQTTVSSSSIGGARLPDPFQFTALGPADLSEQSTTQIGVQSADTVNRLIHFQLVDLVIGIDGKPSTVKDSTGVPTSYVPDLTHPAYQSSNNDPTNSNFVPPAGLTTAAPVGPLTNTPTSAAVVGTFDPIGLTYTPPRSISKNPNLPPAASKPVEYIGLLIIPDEPSAQPRTLQLHLNAPVVVAHSSVSLGINTVAQPNVNKFSLFANVPGDKDFGKKVTFTIFLKSDPRMTPVPGIIAPDPSDPDHVTIITAPTAVNEYIIRVTSVLQPSQTRDVTVSVTASSGSTFQFN